MKILLNDHNAGMDQAGLPSPCIPMTVHIGVIDVLCDRDIRKQHQYQLVCPVARAILSFTGVV